MKAADLEQLRFRVKAIREGNAVKRCHAVQYHGEYTVGSHSVNAVALLLILNPEASANLIKSLLWHDIAERFLGDLPSTARSGFPDLNEAYSEAESKIEELLQIKFQLTSEEINWLKAIDSLELWLWCIEQRHMGNRNIEPWIKNLEIRLISTNTPVIVTNFMQNYNPERINEVAIWSQLKDI